MRFWRKPTEATERESDRFLRELEDHQREVAWLERVAEEHEKDRRELQEQLNEVKEELRALQLDESASGEKIEALFEERRKLEERGDAFQKRGEELVRRSAKLRRSIDEQVKTTEQGKQAFLEGQKMFFELFKLVATLDTGILVAMTAIAVGLIPEPTSLDLLWLSYSLVLLSIVCSVTAAGMQALRITETLLPFRDERTLNRWPWGFLFYWLPVYLALGGLSVGIIAFGQFISRNLW